MRLWHKNLIPVLPRQQLLGQWRECCAIAHNIINKGTPNHLLVNKIMSYSEDHFYEYGWRVYLEMQKRGYKADWKRFASIELFPYPVESVSNEDLFAGWHNDRYLLQCYYNLEEKYDCGGISEEEWRVIISDL